MDIKDIQIGMAVVVKATGKTGIVSGIDGTEISVYIDDEMIQEQPNGQSGSGSGSDSGDDKDSEADSDKDKKSKGKDKKKDKAGSKDSEADSDKDKKSKGKDKKKDKAGKSGKEGDEEGDEEGEEGSSSSNGDEEGDEGSSSSSGDDDDSSKGDEEGDDKSSDSSSLNGDDDDDDDSSKGDEGSSSDDDDDDSEEGEEGEEDSSSDDDDDDDDDDSEEGEEGEPGSTSSSDDDDDDDSENHGKGHADDSMDEVADRIRKELDDIEKPTAGQGNLEDLVDTLKQIEKDLEEKAKKGDEDAKNVLDKIKDKDIDIADMLGLNPTTALPPEMKDVIDRLAQRVKDTNLMKSSAWRAKFQNLLDGIFLGTKGIKSPFKPSRKREPVGGIPQLGAPSSIPYPWCIALLVDASGSFSIQDYKSAMVALEDFMRLHHLDNDVKYYVNVWSTVGSEIIVKGSSWRRAVAHYFGIQKAAHKSSKFGDATLIFVPLMQALKKVRDYDAMIIFSDFEIIQFENQSLAALRKHLSLNKKILYVQTSHYWHTIEKGLSFLRKADPHYKQKLVQIIPKDIV